MVIFMRVKDEFCGKEVLDANIQIVGKVSDCLLFLLGTGDIVRG